MRAIYKRELRSYFHSMIGYVFIAFLVAYTGIYFLAYNLNYGYPYFSYVLSGILFVYLVAIPILTMRCFADCIYISQFLLAVKCSAFSRK